MEGMVTVGWETCDLLVPYHVLLVYRLLEIGQIMSRHHASRSSRQASCFLVREL